MNLNCEAAKKEPFGIATKFYTYDDHKQEWPQTILNYLRLVNKGQQLALFGEQQQALALVEVFEEHTGAIFINKAGGRGPDYLPFEHLGHAGHGSLSGFKHLYRQATRSLRISTK